MSRLESNPQLKVSIEPLQGWEQSPLQMIGGIEMLEHMKVDGRGLGSIEGFYKELRKRVWPGTILTISIMGMPGSAKGGKAMGLYRLFINDEFLQARLESQDSSLELIVSPHSMAARGAKTESFRSWHPELWVDPSMKAGTYSADIYSKISRARWAMIDEEVLSKLHPNKATILIDESSGPTSFPITSRVPVEVAGVRDRGNSPFFNLAFDPRTRPNFVGIEIERNPNVYQFAKTWRQEAEGRREGAVYNLFSRESKGVISVGKDLEIDVMRLPEEALLELQQLTREISLPASTMALADQDFRRMMIGLRDAGLVSDLSQRSFYGFLNRRLDLPYGQIHRTNTEYFQGERVVDFGYYLSRHNLFVRLFGKEVVPPILLSCIRNRERSVEEVYQIPGQSSYADTPYIHQPPGFRCPEYRAIPDSGSSPESGFDLY